MPDKIKFNSLIFKIMAVKYTVTEKSNPQKPEAPKKWYANAKSTGDTTLRTLGREIAARSTVSPADTQAVLVALTEVLTEHLAEGKIARLGDFGAFQVSISSEGAETEDKFNASMVKNQKVVFRAGIDIKEMLNNLKFEKA
jgi:predicted histone-like DNA-binding protein